MKNISLTFLIHQPVRLKRYRFFNIGNDNYYYDDYDNERKIRIIADECYLPNNNILLKLLTKYKGRFKVSFSVSGTTIDLLKLYAPEIVRSFQLIAALEGVEFVAETYTHSLACLKNTDEFKRQAERHAKKIADLFGSRPCVFKNTELMYSDRIGEIAAELGFNSVFAEEASHVQGWKGPDRLYCHPTNPLMNIIFQNRALSNYASLCLANHELKSYECRQANFLSLLSKLPENENTVNLCLDYEIIRRTKGPEGNVLCSFESFLTNLAESRKYNIKSLSEIGEDHQIKSEISIPDSYLSAEGTNSFAKLQGNELQREALEKLYGIRYKINPVTDHNLWTDWQYLQSSDHFYYMSSRFFSDGHAERQYNPYDNPYEAFINYMNVLSDFTIRLTKIPVRNIGSDPLTIKPKRKIATVS